MYFDSHTHLNNEEFFDNRKYHLKLFEDIGGKGLCNAGASELYNKNAITISRNKNTNIDIKTFIGYHPYEIFVGNITKQNINLYINNLENLYLQNKNIIDGIGECGIDLNFENLDLELQSQLLSKQCEIAKKYNLPLIIHSRGSKNNNSKGFDLNHNILKSYKEQKIYFHCRSYGSEEVKLVQETYKNGFIGFAGNITYPKAENIRESAKFIDQNKILIETDIPYLAPQKYRGKTNQLIYIEENYNYIAKLLDIDLNQLQKLIKNNFYSFYQKDV